MGREDRPEDRPHPGEGRAAPGSHDLSGRRRGRPHLRADQDLPGPLPRGADLLQRGAALGRGAAGLHPLRAVARRLRLSPRAHGSRDHGRRQGLALRRQPAHGRDGHRREDDARGARWRAHALHGLRLRRRARGIRRGRDRDREALPHVHARILSRDAGAPRGGRAQGGAADRRDRAVRPAQVLRHVRGHRPDRRRGLLVRRQAALRPGDHRRAGAARRSRRRHRGQPAQGEGRRADGRFLRQGRQVHLALQRVQHPSRVPVRRRGVHGRDEGRAARGSSATARRWSSPPRRRRCRRSR